VITKGASKMGGATGRGNENHPNHFAGNRLPRIAPSLWRSYASHKLTRSNNDQSKDGTSMNCRHSKPDGTVSRRDLLALLSLASAGPTSLAATGDADMMWSYFIRELTIEYERRKQKLSAIRTHAELAALQTKVKRVMRTGLGVFPERTPLNARQTGEIRQARYVIEKIIFESQPGYYVTANVYRPDSMGTRRPAVVHSCGHGRQGKSLDDYQCACIGLALNGFVTLIFDPMGQGERFMYPKPADDAMPLNEHAIAGVPTLLVGRTLANYRMWDIVRAFDYLETRPDVDRARMGMLGHSGGGMMTLLTSPLEPRIRAAMSCCAVTTFYHKTRVHLIADAEQILPGIYPNGIDHPEMIATVAPRPFLIGAVLKDFVPLDGTRRTYEEVKPIYEMLGVPENVGLVESDNIHKLDKNLREACYGWMLRHLAEEKTKPREPELRIQTEQDLWCTPTGRIMDLRNARGVFDLNRDYSHLLRKQREAAKKPIAPAVRALLGMPAIRAARYHGDRFETEPGIELPSTHFPAARPDTLILLAAEQGRNSRPAQEIARAFQHVMYPVLSVDLRGWGETIGRTPSKYKFTWDDFCAWRAVEMSRPLLGMRVQDLISVVREASSRYKKIYVVGIEAGGLVALHAGALDHSIAGVATWQTLIAYQDLMERPFYNEPVASVVWDALVTYDIPELASLAGPRPYIAVDPLDSLRRPVAQPAHSTDQAAQAILTGLHLA
jgi:cephalosporin-C deacetylase-like acetyl esterase